MTIPSATKGEVPAQHPGPSLELASIRAAIGKRIFIGRIPVGTNDGDLAAIYQPYGTLTECRVVAAKGNNCIGFVGFESWATTHRAILDTDGRMRLPTQEGNKQTVVVSFAERPAASVRGGSNPYTKGLSITRVFVGSLPEDTTESELTEKFSSIGLVDGACLLPAKGRHRCGYVNYQIWGEALDAVELLHGKPLREGADPMTVVLAQPRDGGAGSKAPPAPALTPVGTLPNLLMKRRRVDELATSLLLLPLQEVLLHTPLSLLHDHHSTT